MLGWPVRKSGLGGGYGGMRRSGRVLEPRSAKASRKTSGREANRPPPDTRMAIAPAPGPQMRAEMPARAVRFQALYSPARASRLTPRFTWICNFSVRSGVVGGGSLDEDAHPVDIQVPYIGVL